MRKTRHLLAFLLIFIFVFSVSLIAFAQDNTEESLSDETIAEETEVVLQYTGDINGKELPEINEEDVEKATSELIEKEENETPNILGVIIYLLIAVFIALIVGVIVSKKTRK